MNSFNNEGSNTSPQLETDRMDFELMRTIVILPTYNERENIVRLVPDLLALPDEMHVLILDDISPDGTGQLADALSSKHNAVMLTCGCALK